MTVDNLEPEESSALDDRFRAAVNKHNGILTKYHRLAVICGGSLFLFMWGVFLVPKIFSSPVFVVGFAALMLFLFAKILCLAIQNFSMTSTGLSCPYCSQECAYAPVGEFCSSCGSDQIEKSLLSRSCKKCFAILGRDRNRMPRDCRLNYCTHCGHKLSGGDIGFKVQPFGKISTVESVGS